MSLDNTPWVIGIVQDTIDRIHEANPHLDFSVLPPPSGPVYVAFKHLFQRQDDCDITSNGGNSDGNSNNNNNSKSNGNGVMIGAIVGSVVGVLLLAGLGFFLYRRRVKKREAAFKAQPPAPPPMAMAQHAHESHPKFAPQSIPPHQPNNFANTPTYTAPPSTVPPSSVGGDHPSWYNPAATPGANPAWANPQQYPYPNQSPTPTPGTDSTTNYYSVAAVTPNVPPAGVPYPGPHPWANPQPQPGYSTPPAPSSSGSQSPAPMVPPHLNEKAQYSGYSTSTSGPFAGGSSSAAHVPAWSPDVKSQSGPASSPPADPMPPPAYSGNN